MAKGAASAAMTELSAHGPAGWRLRKRSSGKNCWSDWERGLRPSGIHQRAWITVLPAPLRVFVESVAARGRSQSNKRAPTMAVSRRTFLGTSLATGAVLAAATRGRSVGSRCDLQADRAAARRSRAAAAGVDTPAVDRRRESRCDGRLRPDDAHAARRGLSARRAAADRRSARHLRDARCRRAAHVRRCISCTT